MSHHCHAKGCAVKTRPVYLMCPKHWAMVPQELQRPVWATYRVGQCDDKRPSKEWHEAADAAIKFVFEKEFKARKSATAEDTAKENRMENTTQITVNVKSNASNSEIATALRWRANLFDGMEPKAACSVEATSTPSLGKVSKATTAKAAPAAETEAADDEDFGGSAKKSTKGKAAPAKAAASFDEEELNEEQAEESAETESSDDEGDFMEAAPAKKETKKKITVNDVNDACKAKAAASDRKTVLGILKKKFNVTSVTELDAKQYADVVKAMAV